MLNGNLPYKTQIMRQCYIVKRRKYNKDCKFLAYKNFLVFAN